MNKYFTLSLAMFLACCANAAELSGLDWKTGRFGTLKNNHIQVAVPVGEKASTTLQCAVAQLDLTPFQGKSIAFTIRARAKEVSKPSQLYYGVKFMLRFSDGGTMRHCNISNCNGTFDWKELCFIATVPEDARKGELLLGLQESSGEVEFNIDSLAWREIFPRVNADYKVSYPEKIAATPPLRGVMSPYTVTEEDLATLKKWNVNLLRFQIVRNWHRADTERDLPEYDRWLEGKLKHLDWILSRAPKYGIRVVIDMHTPPGGRYADRNMAMFYEEIYAKHFIAVWEKMAARYRENPAVWGYNLINEPMQSLPAPYDYWNLQRLAAEAVRKIDPDTPIIIENNYLNGGSSFSILSPLAMDNVIYQAHMYEPGYFTHRIQDRSEGYPGMLNGKLWNKEALRNTLQSVRDFQLRHNARIYIGEFSTHAWTKGGAQYLQDLVDIFEEYGWDWSYHAFRETIGWSLEHDGPNRKELKPSKDNDRLRVMLDAFSRNRQQPDNRLP